MAKRNYESKVEGIAAAFIESRGSKEQEQTENLVDTKPMVEQKSEEVLANPSLQTSSNEVSEPQVKGSDLNRYTFYITVEEKAALDQISIDEDMGKSEILREVLDAGLEAVSPGIFERTKERANELRMKVKVTKDKKERKIYDRLKKTFTQ